MPVYFGVYYIGSPKIHVGKFWRAIIDVLTIDDFKCWYSSTVFLRGIQHLHTLVDERSHGASDSIYTSFHYSPVK